MKKLALISILMGLAGCSSELTLTLPYTPQTTEEMKGNVSVADFKYFPKPGVRQDEIPDTAAGKILLTETVGQFVTKAVKREFHQAGLTESGHVCSLDGEINEFSVDALGFSVDYKSDIRYILYDRSQHVLFDNVEKVGFNASKFVTPEIVISNLNKTIADNINKLLTDEEFKKNVRLSCVK